MTGKLKVDLVKENEEVIRQIIAQMVFVNGDGEVDMADFTELLYREFGREATKNEALTLHGYIEDFVDGLERAKKRSFL
jgi:hypothetical protein